MGRWSSSEVFSSGGAFSAAVPERGLWVVGSMPFCLSFFLMLEFHRFLISLSVLPGRRAAICDHLAEKGAAGAGEDYGEDPRGGRRRPF